jgi:hypothetical protein
MTIALGILTPTHMILAARFTGRSGHQDRFAFPWRDDGPMIVVQLEFQFAEELHLLQIEALGNNNAADVSVKSNAEILCRNLG